MAAAAGWRHGLYLPNQLGSRQASAHRHPPSTYNPFTATPPATHLRAGFRGSPALPARCPRPALAAPAPPPLSAPLCRWACLRRRMEAQRGAYLPSAVCFCVLVAGGPRDAHTPCRQPAHPHPAVCPQLKRGYFQVPALAQPPGTSPVSPCSSVSFGEMTARQRSRSGLRGAVAPPASSTTGTPAACASCSREQGAALPTLELCSSRHDARICLAASTCQQL